MKRFFAILVVALLTTIGAYAFIYPQYAAAEPAPVDFNGYWYQGKAELSRYALEQERYGEIRQGDAVLIFVTEDFWSDKQVKYESGPRTDAVVSTLKMNMTRKFWTGIYPYSIMTSVFSPVGAQADGPLKVSGTTQEWCGHTFSQLNQVDGESYRFLQFSYFQEEGDRKSSIKGGIPEDGLWTQLRLDPQALPVGDLYLIPALHFLRLKHKAPDPQKATAKLSTLSNPEYGEGELIQYEVQYRDLGRRLKIVADSAFPHVIRYWEETMGSDGMVTRAKLTHQVRNNYWSLHSEADSGLRKTLGLGE